MPLVSHACSERAPLSWRCITNEVWVGAASSRMMRCGTVTTAINSTVHATSTTTAAAGRQTAAALPLDIPPPRPPPRLFTLLSLLPFPKKQIQVLFRAGQGKEMVEFHLVVPSRCGSSCLLWSSCTCASVLQHMQRSYCVLAACGRRCSNRILTLSRLYLTGACRREQQ